MKIEDVTNCKVALSRVDELNKLACFPCMGLHSSAGRELKRENNTEAQREYRSLQWRLHYIEVH